MARINLLPWRDELRRKREKNFFIAAGIAVALMAGVVYGIQVKLQQDIDYQKGRNKFLVDQTKLLDKKLKSIRDLDEKKQSMIARMEIITQLQASRPEVVHLFDELVRTIPEGVYYSQITQRGKSVSVDGVAQSNAFVSKLIRNLNASDWLDGADLEEIVSSSGQGGNDLLRLARFKLKVNQVRKSDAGKKQAEGEGG